MNSCPISQISVIIIYIANNLNRRGIMGAENQKESELQDIPTKPEEGEKAKKLKAAPDAVLAKAIHEMLMKDSGAE
jgi:UTP-glucose-1-phosphate uridylyltransferase